MKDLHAADARGGEPSGLLRNAEAWNWAAKVSTVGIFILALGATLAVLDHVVVPLILAWVIATVLIPLVKMLCAIRIPRALAVVLLVALLLITVLAILTILSVPLSYWLSRTDELGQLIKDKLALIHRPLEMLEELGKALNPSTESDKPPVFVNAPRSSMISAMFGVLTPAIDEFMIFVIALVFHLIYQREIQSGLVSFAGSSMRGVTRDMLADIERSMSNYFGTVTIVNLLVGTATAAIAYVLDFPHPILWGLFAAVMNYIPYLGPLIVMGAFFIVGVVVFPSLNEAILAPLLFLALNTVEGQVITPSFVGHRLTINPFLVFLSIAFWTWMWGPLGAFLATPLLVTLMVASRHLSAIREAEAHAAPSRPVT